MRPSNRKVVGECTLQSLATSSRKASKAFAVVFERPSSIPSIMTAYSPAARPPKTVEMSLTSKALVSRPVKVLSPTGLCFARSRMGAPRSCESCRARAVLPVAPTAETRMMVGFSVSKITFSKLGSIYGFPPPPATKKEGDG